MNKYQKAAIFEVKIGLEKSYFVDWDTKRFHEAVDSIIGPGKEYFCHWQNDRIELVERKDIGTVKIIKKCSYDKVDETLKEIRS